VPGEQRWAKGEESKKFQGRQLPRFRLARCELFPLRCHGYSLLLSPIPIRIRRKENFSCSACGHHLQDLTHLLLDCLASEPLGAPYLAPLLPFLVSGPDLRVWPDCWVSVEFLHSLSSPERSQVAPLSPPMF